MSKRPQRDNLVDTARDWAQAAPDRTVHICLDENLDESDRLTFGQLDAHARSVAAALQRRYTRGERVLLLQPHGLDFITALQGCMYAGLIAVPCPAPQLNRPLDRLEAITRDAAATAAFVDEAFLTHSDRAIRHAPYLAGLHRLTVPGLLTEKAGEWHDTGLKSDDIAFLQYTSGSTSQPRGVMVTHASVVADVRMIIDAFQTGPDKPMVSWLPLFHDMGLIGGVIHNLVVGNPSVLFAPELFNQRPQRWLEAVSRYRGYVSGAPNFAYDYCVEKVTPGEMESLDLSGWQVAFNGAEVVQPATLRRFAAAFAPCGFRTEALTPCYGLAEATLMAASVDAGQRPRSVTIHRKELQGKRVEFLQPENPDAVTLAGCGRARLDGVVKIVEPDSGREVTPGAVGEIWVSGPHVAGGYWGRPQETAAVFRARLDGATTGTYLRTGDLGFIHEHELYIVGRRKDLIIIQGQNYHPPDVEQTVLESHPACQANGAAAFAVEAAGAEHLVVVQEVRRAYRKTNLQEAIRAVRFAVAKHHGIRAAAVVFIRPNSLPKTSSGKVQRLLCRHAFLANGLRIEAEWRAPVFGALSSTDA